MDGFILLVRSLNEAALEARASGTEASWIGVRGARDEMHDSVEHMVELAGKGVGEGPHA